MKNKIFFITFMLVWIVLVILNIIIKNPSFSEQENRYLAKMPNFTFEKLLNGKYQEELDNYINDHFIFRNEWLKIKSGMEILLGKTENNNIYIGKDGYLFEKFEYTNEESKHLENVIKVINEFTKDKTIPIYCMLIPNSIYINKEKLPNNVDCYNQKEIIKEAYNKLDDKIKKVDVDDILLDNRDQYIFFKTDHHMTSLGAYLVYLKFCLSSGNIPERLQNFEKIQVSSSFLGTFDSKAQINNQETDKIDIYINKNNMDLEEVQYDNETTQSIFNTEYLNKKDKYSFFLNGNNAKVVVKTKIKNGKKLLVVKDSYAHIMAQFLCQNYEEIHFIDPRYYKLSLTDYIQDNEITETLFLYNVSNIIKDLGILSIE